MQKNEAKAAVDVEVNVENQALKTWQFYIILVVVVRTVVGCVYMREKVGWRCFSFKH